MWTYIGKMGQRKKLYGRSPMFFPKVTLANLLCSITLLDWKIIYRPRDSNQGSSVFLVPLGWWEEPDVGYEWQLRKVWLKCLLTICTYTYNEKVSTKYCHPWLAACLLSLRYKSFKLNWHMITYFKSSERGNLWDGGKDESRSQWDKQILE